MGLKSVIGLLAAGLLTACGGGGDDDGPASPRGPASVNAGTVSVTEVSLPDELGCGHPDYAEALLEAINEARAQARTCGDQFFPAVHALQWNLLLGQAAAGHSTDMATQDFFSHTGSDGSSSAERVRATGYQPRYQAEILALGQGSHSQSDEVIPQSVAGWLASPPHCRIVMSPLPAELGAACVRNGQKAWTTVNLGA
ncbi:CAP domain-containing protein [Hydrogenophaga sp.]|uniref:CAP domain-containing protein n=1 Tax=Hydrogenophaga sp. TaxID=1904254 RepID=UPI002CE728A0|nr:CAP domain-containing protein [Hydrogenophaga sp.]HMO69743.1 CAP domain-containing protein [Novosphingobium sp.]HMP12085.1 CAP domain-containing protein [Hydrogenophaga sp.]